MANDERGVDQNQNNIGGDEKGQNIPGRGQNNRHLKGSTPKNLTPSGIKKAAISNATKQAINNSSIADSKAGKAAQTAANVAQTATTIAIKAKALGGALAGLLLNPVFWTIVVIVVLVWAVVVNVFSFTQTIGKNDNADGCYGIGANNSSTVVFQEGDTEMDRANKMATWLLSQPSWEVTGGKPLTKNQAFAMVGNFLAESAMDPGNIEASAPNREEYLGADNDRIFVWLQKHTANGTNIGIGIVQWTWNPGRAGDLIQKARDTGTQWYEIQPQLEFMKEEMDSDYYKNALIARGFDDGDRPIEELAIAFHEAYERSEDTPEMAARRGQMGKEVAEQYVGGSSTGGRTGGSCTRGGRGNVDMSSAVALAISIAYEPSERAKATTTDGKGMNNAKPEYIDAKKMAEEASTPDTYLNGELFASCDRVVATIVKNTLDPEFPWGPTATQYDYLRNHEDWDEIQTQAEVEPGDVLVTKGNGHIVMFIGDYDGTRSIVQGSYTDQVANIQSDWVTERVGGEYAAFRFVGTPARTDSAFLE